MTQKFNILKLTIKAAVNEFWRTQNKAVRLTTELHRLITNC